MLTESFLSAGARPARPPMLLARWGPVTVLRGYHEAPMHELTGTGKTGCGGRRSLAQPQHEVASRDGISPVGYSVKHDADGVGAAL